ncbi:response regulator transcription factor [Oceanospirillum linum]|uniref:Two-component system response regulator n=1 Tax=Oceanospirillum linum TaxID=966 RepID=A0A1T1HDV5_OCELI|nr:response regulator transcription factor [Oceanospirillum linum]OOV88044.1 two-component system response regulator [Oceanospirillum linum]SEF41178.1 two-component system, response regulator RegA [Oleiphilus messinensis]SMP00618.1 two-component system, response regulator RegA [Oceanospirillum linum]
MSPQNNLNNAGLKEPELRNNTFLIVDDDPVFSQVMSRSLTRRGYNTIVAESAEEALPLIEQHQPSLASLDLKMEGDTGLNLLPRLLKLVPDCKVVILTGYSSIATAVEAIKLGAVNYLPKPADTDEILAALKQTGANPSQEIADKPMSVNRLTWEHIQKVLTENDGNISATARQLGMHRRTLQRKLQKRPVRE